MTDKRKLNFLVEPWARCEETIHALGMHDLDKLARKLGTTTAQGIFGFLADIGFVENEKLAPPGSDYFRSKFILNDGDSAEKILSDAVRQYSPTQAICQLFWGRPSLKRTNVYNLLVFEEYIDRASLSEDQIGSFLMLLNQCGIIRYSKKTNDVTIIFNPRTTSLTKTSTRFLSPETPYSNLRHLWEALRNCTSFVHWFDKHFGARGLEVLHDEADGTKIHEIRILSGLAEREVLTKLRRDFERFREEMKVRSIGCDLRIICDKQLLHNIHDRWILSRDVCYNVPPINSIFKGQYSEMKETTNRPPFSDWWEKGADLLGEWQRILVSLNERPADSPLLDREMEFIGPAG